MRRDKEDAARYACGGPLTAFVTASANGFLWESILLTRLLTLMALGLAVDGAVAQRVEPQQALQAYVEAQIADPQRRGPVLLPPGDYAGDLDLRHLVGVEIAGSGATPHQREYRKAWNQRGVNYGTRIIGHIRLTSVLEFTLSRLTVESPDDERSCPGGRN